HVTIVATRGADTDRIPQKPNSASRRSVRSNDAGKGKAHRFDTTEVVARKNQIKDFLRQTEEATASLTRLNKSKRIKLRQRHMFCHFELALVLRQVRGFKPAQIVLELFARE